MSKRLEIERMPAKRRVARREWSSRDVRELKNLARQKTPARIIGRRLKRSEGAVRQKAFAMGLSLRVRATLRRTKLMARLPSRLPFLARCGGAPSCVRVHH